jgi:dihydrofolate reductase
MSPKPRISIIAAMSQNYVIGNRNKLPWHIPADLLRFKRLTLDHPIIMGRKTYQSIGHPLPNRTNIVLTQHSSLIPDVHTVHNLHDAINYASGLLTPEIFIIGGAEIFALALPITERIYLTIVHQNYFGDTYFPQYNSEFNSIVAKEDHFEVTPAFTFLTLERLARVSAE